jgi:hypothetical protein
MTQYLPPPHRLLVEERRGAHGTPSRTPFPSSDQTQKEDTRTTIITMIKHRGRARQGALSARLAFLLHRPSVCSFLPSLARPGPAGEFLRPPPPHPTALGSDPVDVITYTSLTPLQLGHPLVFFLFQFTPYPSALLFARGSRAIKWNMPIGYQRFATRTG